jgi:cytochrome c oxidase assembly protein subunit 15
MFALPIKFWRGGAFFEHTHRLLASGAGFLTTILAVWLWLKDSRRWMKWLGVVAFLLVIAQGVLGGLRVTMKMDSLGIYHGVIAQGYFVLLCAIALFTSQFWQNISEQKLTAPRRLRNFVLATTVLIFVQLILGATMRHQHAGLAVPDFPLAYGELWPDTSAAAVARYNTDRVEVISVSPITAFQIELQMAHRLVAVLILIAVALCAWLARSTPACRRISVFWLALILAQIGLGAWTIWSNKAADAATLHVMMGALSLVTGALWCVVNFWRPAETNQMKATPPQTFGVSPAMAGNK